MIKLPSILTCSSKIGMRFRFNLAVLLSFFLPSCASVEKFVKDGIQKPQLEFINAKLSGLSFESADMLFDIRITNPNPVGVTLAGFDYDFLINGNHFLKGEQEQNVQIPSNGTNRISIPLSLGFKDLYNTFKSIGKEDSTNYQLDVGVSFDLPVLGTRRVPISKKGTVPLLKLPRLSIAAFKVDKLNLTGADITLRVKLDNPNALSFLINKLDYKMDINNRSWLQGTSTSAIQIDAKRETEINLPVSLNFLQIGTSAFQLLNGSKSLDYYFRGKLDLTSSIPLLGEVTLPFDKRGTVGVIK